MITLKINSSAKSHTRVKKGKRKSEAILIEAQLLQPLVSMPLMGVSDVEIFILDI